VAGRTPDQLRRLTADALLYIAIALVVVNLFLHSTAVSLAGLALIVGSWYFRMRRSVRHFEPTASRPTEFRRIFHPCRSARGARTGTEVHLMSINTPRRRSVAAIAAAAVGFVIAVIAIFTAGTNGIILIPFAFVALVLALYFNGPTDARSFRLYRKPVAVTPAADAE
jgi:hypothetical protein